MAREEIGRITDPESLQFNTGRRQEREAIWQPIVRRLTYKGIEGDVIFFHDGIADRLVFKNFPSGTEREKLLWEKLIRSIQALNRKVFRGSYKVEIGEETGRVGVSLVYSDRHYPGKRYLQERFEEIWRDLSQRLPHKPGLVKLGKAQAIKEFDIQDLLI